jgi:hypothetical protein|mmetsp:Transcript_5495/g.20755  ORF Transcript_5495/g.20755 Transcript_5495/m.20755 type:complete len:298 (-) Transcript_5495:308-1201(-)
MATVGEDTHMLRGRASLKSDTHDDYGTTGRYLVGTVLFPMLLIAGVLGCFAVDHPTAGFRQGAGYNGGVVEYSLHTSCVSAETKGAMPGFFRPGARVIGASIVRHDPKRPGLGMEEGVAMQRAPASSSPSGELGSFVATAEMRGDWGFVLHNNFGESFYEIGEGNDAPMWGKTCPDARTFRERLGRAIGKIVPGGVKLGWKDEEEEKHASFVFGSCDTRCPSVVETSERKNAEAKTAGKARDAKVAKVSKAVSDGQPAVQTPPPKQHVSTTEPRTTSDPQGGKHPVELRAKTSNSSR